MQNNKRKLKSMKKVLFILSVFILSVFILCSCGFKPLYQHNEAGLGKVALSQEIFIDVIPTRSGQILRNKLKEKISSADANAKYKLKTNLSIRTTDLGITSDDVATRKRLWVSAKFKLLENNKILLTGTTSNNVSYAINDNEFITLTTKDAEIKKSLSIIADDIKLKIASYLK